MRPWFRDLLLLQALFFCFLVRSSHAQPVRGNPGDLWADLILGQVSFGDINANQVTNKGLFNPYSVVVDTLHGRLYVYDSGNNRVLGVSDLSSLTSGQGADVVLGQPDFIHSACNGDSNWQNYPNPPVPNASCLCGLRYDFQSPAEGGSVGNMAVDGQGNLYVPDYFNNRVLRYDWPIASGQAASHVWGQPDFTQYQYNNVGGNTAGSASSSRLYFFYNGVPDNHYYAGVAIDNWGNLWVADAMNNRVLRFPNPSVPAIGVPSTTADVVLGQGSFTASTTPSGFTDLSHLDHPGSVRVDSSGNVYVTDLLPNGVSPFYFGGRVLVYKPTGNDASGQPRYGATNTGLTASGSVTQYMDQVDGLEWDPSGDLWVSQLYESVLLHFTLTPSVSATVTKVLMEASPIGPGQVYNATSGDGPNFTDNAGEASPSYLLAQDLRGSVGVDSSGNVYAPGGRWHDVLRFPAPIPLVGSLPAGEAHSADLQVFKPSQWRVMNNIGNNDMFIGAGVAVASGQVIEANVNRLAFWNMPSGPSGLSNGQTADGFAGTAFPDLWFNNPFGRIREDKASPQHLWVIHNMNGNVQLEPYLLPLHNGDMPMAGKVIKSPLPILGGGSLAWTAMEGLDADPSGHYLWLSDKLGNRVFRVRDPFGVSGGPIVDIILGQPNATSVKCNSGGTLQSDQICTSSVLNASTLYVPGAIRLDHHGDLFVSDHSLENEGNYRMLRFNAASIQNNSTTTCLFGVAAAAVYGTNGSFGAIGCQSANGVCGPWEPAFNANDSQLVVGLNSQAPSIKFPIVLSNPLTGDNPSGHLQDFGPQSYSATFDDQDNLYVTELNRNRIMVYYQPFGAPSPLPTFTPTPTGSATPTPTPTPTITSTPTSTITPIPTGVYVIRVNANGNSMTSTDGRDWLLDKTYSVGSYGFTGSTSTVQGSCSPVGIAPADYSLFNTVRYAASMDYKFDLPQADTYHVTLYFDECFHNPGESRSFKILAQGTQVDQFDLVPLCVATDGTRYLLTKSYDVVIGPGNLTLDMGFLEVNDYALVSAIQVVGTLQIGTSTPTNSPTITLTPTSTPTPSPTKSPTPTGSATPTPTNTWTITPSPTFTPTGAPNCCQSASNWTLPTLSNGSGVAVDMSRDRIYAVDRGTGALNAYNYDGTSVTGFGTSGVKTGLGAFAVAIGTCAYDGVYIVQRQSPGYVIKLDASGNVVWTSANVAGGGNRSIEVDNSGTVYVLSDGGSLYLLDNAGTIQNTLSGYGFNAATGTLKVGSTLYVADTLNDRIVSLPQTGTYTFGSATVVVPTVTTPYTLAKDLAGNFYAASANTNAYEVYNSSWALQNTCVNGVLLAGAFGIDVDETGSVYVAGQGGSHYVAKMQPCYSQPAQTACTPTPTNSPTGTWYTSTVTSTPTASPTASPTLTPSSTPTNSATSSATNSPTNTPTTSTTSTPTISPTTTPTLTPSSTPTNSTTSSPTNSPTATPSSTSSNSPTNSMTSTPSPTPSLTTTSTPTGSATTTPTPSPTSTGGCPEPFAYPNPVRDNKLTLRFPPCQAGGKVRVRLYTLAQRKVLDEEFDYTPQGTDPALELTDNRGTPLANGLYYMVVSSSQGRAILKILILR